jgi:phage tail-like protein
MMPATPRPYASRYLFSLDGFQAGFIKSVDGGSIMAEVISQIPGPGSFTKKQLGAIKYEDITMQIGLGMGKPIYDWIAQAWTMRSSPRSGSILTLDHDNEAKSERQFTNALIAEVTIPAMDAASKEAAYITIKLRPETVQFKKRSGKVNPPNVTHKNWLAGNFKLQIDGLDCSKVNKIDSFTVKVSTAEDRIGDARTHQTGIEFPNLKVTLPESHAQTWIDWHEDFVVKGNNGDDREKQGSITFLSQNKGTELGRIDLFNLGIFKLAFNENAAASDSIRRVTAHLYCERMEFKYGQ